MSSDDESTLQTTRSEPVHPYLELHLLLNDGREQWLQLGSSPLDLSVYFGEEWPWTSQLRGAEVHCLSAVPNRLARLGKLEVAQAVLCPGDCLEFGEHRLWLMDARLAEVAWLETWPGADGAQTWNLKPRAYRVGRRGRGRLNHIELSHPTISRAQATLLPMPSDRFSMLVESTSSPTLVNGRIAPAGEMLLLHHGDLIQFGEQSLRFRQNMRFSSSSQVLRVESLAGFTLHWGDLSIPEVSWKVSKARSLMSRLAWAWDEPLSLAYVLELLWPEQSELRARKNLSHCLVDIRATLQLKNEGDLLLRTSSLLQLNPAALGEHDALNLLHLAKGEEVSGWAKAVQMYRGPYLPGSIDGWVEQVRQELDRAFIQACLKLSRHYVCNGMWEPALEVAQTGLRYDGCQTELAETAMQSCLRLDLPDQAILCFESVSAQLKKVRELEPTTELIRLWMQAKGIKPE